VDGWQGVEVGRWESERERRFVARRVTNAALQCSMPLRHSVCGCKKLVTLKGIGSLSRARWKLHSCSRALLTIQLLCV
jgi:hypothetical protein